MIERFLYPPQRRLIKGPVHARESRNDPVSLFDVKRQGLPVKLQNPMPISVIRATLDSLFEPGCHVDHTCTVRCLNDHRPPPLLVPDDHS